jgi:hypothetical protein
MVYKLKSVNNLTICIKGVFSYRLLLLSGVVFFAFIGSLSKSLNIYSEYIYALENWLGGDKYLHFIVSFAIGFTVTWATPYRFRPCFYHTIGLPTFVFLLAITSDELLQVYFPTREFSVYDLLTNISGMFSGVFIYKFVEVLMQAFIDKKEDNASD